MGHPGMAAIAEQTGLSREQLSPVVQQERESDVEDDARGNAGVWGLS